MKGCTVVFRKALTQDTLHLSLYLSLSLSLSFSLSPSLSLTPASPLCDLK